MNREQERLQKRQLKFDNIQFRAEEKEGVKYLRGYPILFNTPGKPYRGSEWMEVIDQRALDDVDLSDLRFLVNHDMGQILGRAGKNLRYEIDNTGLFVEVRLPDTQLAKDTYELVSQGIMDGMSFSFYADRWETDSEKMIDRIMHFTDIIEVSAVTFPAYEQTVVIATERVETDPEEEAKKQALINLINEI